jgi:hypothetical protein
MAAPPLCDYRLTASCRGFELQTERTAIRAEGIVGGKLRFAALGDNRTNPQDWAKVAGAVVKAKPDLVVHTGDLVASGRDDWQWDQECFGPAKGLFAAIPCFPVIGNHEENSPLYGELFYSPTADGRGSNWTHRIGKILLIGIDSGKEWSTGGECAKWLEAQLAGAKDANFIFLASHDPAWTSGTHGSLGPDGRPSERAVRQFQDVVFPLLAKYRATAMIVGHDHFYERSEPPGGVTQIITGGAGAPLRQKAENAAKQNPYSKAFASTLHYCLLEVDETTCTMKAFDLEGKTIDSRTWEARKTE